MDRTEPRADTEPRRSPPEARPAEPRLAEPRLADARPAEPRLAEPRLAEPRHAGPRAAAEPRPCAAAAALRVVGERWSLLVLRELFYGVRRFDGIARNTGAPRNILTARLRHLESEGVIERRRYADRPPRYEYHLTAAGRELLPVLLALLEWGGRHAGGESDATIRHSCGAELTVRHSCAACAEEVRWRDLAVEFDDSSWDAGRTMASRPRTSRP